MKYRLKVDSDLEEKAKAGSIVYDISGYDYGLASDDTRITGIKHISVTLKSDGSAPSFTIPKKDLEEIKEIAMSPGPLNTDDPTIRSILKEYPQCEIFRKNGQYEMCQVMTHWDGIKIPCPKYIACNSLAQGDQFVAHQAMGTWCEVDIISFINTVNTFTSMIDTRPTIDRTFDHLG